MKTKSLLALLLGTAFAAGAQAADQREADRVIDRFQAVRPRAAELAIYELDWLPTLKEAKAKAARENRPVFLVVVTNSFGDVCTGHC